MKPILLFLAFLLSTPVHAATVVELPVDGMACSFCVYGLVKQLNALEAVESADVSLKSRRARLLLKNDADLSPELLTDTVRDAGFTPGTPEYSEAQE